MLLKEGIDGATATALKPFDRKKNGKRRGLKLMMTIPGKRTSHIELFLQFLIKRDKKRPFKG